MDAPGFADVAEYELVLPDKEIMEAPAPLALRTAAFFIDMVVASVLFLLPFTAAFLFTMGLQTTDPLALEEFLYDNPYILAVFDMSTFFILLFYFGVFERSTGKTIGKRFLKLKVEPRIGYGRAFLRNISKASVLSALSLPFLSYVLFIDIIWLLFRGDRLLSELAKTKVLYEPKLGEGLKWTQEL
jgi:uncharacterized RDD family membrane protein YckC